MGRLIHLRAGNPLPALFGKLPTALDFVRINHTHPESLALDRWLQLSMQRLAARGEHWPEEPLRFMAVGRQAEHALLGLVAASRDRAGRSFPIAVYVCLPQAQLPQGCAALTLASEPFTRAARQLLSQVTQLSEAALARALRELPAPSPRSIADAALQLDRELAERSLARFASEVFDDVPVAMALEALRRLVERDPRGITCYECPTRAPVDVACWYRLLERSQPPAAACVWPASFERGARALLAHALPERGPLYWVTPTIKHPQLCRLRGGAVRIDGALALATDGGHEALGVVFDRLVRQR